MKNKIIDLFCGCGGLSKGFEKAGFEVELAIDLWEDAVKTYNHNHKEAIAICDDIHNLGDDILNRIKEKGEVVGVVGGPPCQGYSTVGTRDVNDPRNHLYLEYCRIVEKILPEFFVIENVKGLTTLGGGIFKEDIINRFQNLGYKVQYRILNAADYGVPQNRQRVFFVGMKNKKFIFPEGKDYIITSEDALSDLPSLDSEEDSTIYISEPQNEYQRLMRINSNKVLNHEKTNHIEQTISIISMIPDGGNIFDLPEEYWNIRKYNKAFERMSSKAPSNTIDTGHRNYFHYKENRIPSVRESARIQSFPDHFEVLGSKTSQYKQIGNAVPPLLAYEVAQAIRKCL